MASFNIIITITFSYFYLKNDFWNRSRINLYFTFLILCTVNSIIFFKPVALFYDLFGKNIYHTFRHLYFSLMWTLNTSPVILSHYVETISSENLMLYKLLVRHISSVLNILSACRKCPFLKCFVHKHIATLIIMDRQNTRKAFSDLFGSVRILTEILLHLLFNGTKSPGRDND